MYASAIKHLTLRFRRQPLVLCVALVVAACGGSVPPPVSVVPSRESQEVVADEQPTVPPEQAAQEMVSDPDDKPIIVGLLLPLSGAEQATGNALLKAATMALFDAYDPRIRLLPMDTAGDPDIAERRAQEAIYANASIVLGPLLRTNVQAAGDILGPAGVPMIGFSNDSSVAALGRFVMGFLPEAEVKRIIDYASGQGLSDIGALVPEGRYGNRIRLAFGDTAALADVTIAAIESYPPDPDALFEPVKRLASYDERRDDVRQEVRFLRSLRDDVTDEIAEKLEDAEVMEGVSFDAVLVPEGGALMRTLAPLLPFYEIDPNRVKLLGTGLWNDVGLLGEPPLQGGWFAAPDPSGPTAFLNRFEETYGMTAPRIATLAYDAVALVAKLAREPAQATDGEGVGAPSMLDRDPRFSIERLLSPEGFVGVDGLFRFLPDGTTERSLAILEVNRRGFQVVDPAPQSFPAFGYALKN